MADAETNGFARTGGLLDPVRDVLVRCCEVVSAVLLITLSGLLFAGIAARYVFRYPVEGVATATEVATIHRAVSA